MKLSRILILLTQKSLTLCFILIIHPHFKKKAQRLNARLWWKFLNRIYTKPSINAYPPDQSLCEWEPADYSHDISINSFFFALNSFSISGYSLVRAGGFEPPTTRVQGGDSVQTELHPDCLYKLVFVSLLVVNLFARNKKSPACLELGFRNKSLIVSCLLYTSPSPRDA